MKKLMEDWRKFLKESGQTEKIYDLFNYSSATQGIAVAEALGETELAEKFKVLHQAVLRFVEAGLALEQVGRGKDGDEQETLKAALKDIVSPTGSYFKTYKEVATWGGVEKYIPMTGNQWWRNMNSATLHLVHWHAEEDKAAAWESIKDWAGKSELAERDWQKESEKLKDHPNKKARILDTGANKETGGGTGHRKLDKRRGKSAPPGAGGV